MNDDKDPLEMSPEELAAFREAATKIFALTLDLFTSAKVSTMGERVKILQLDLGNEECQRLVSKHCSIILSVRRLSFIRSVVFGMLEEHGPTTCGVWEAAHHIYHCVFNVDLPS